MALMPVAAGSWSGRLLGEYLPAIGLTSGTVTHTMREALLCVWNFKAITAELNRKYFFKAVYPDNINTT
jgi:hypothetical protein